MLIETKFGKKRLRKLKILMERRILQAIFLNELKSKFHFDDHFTELKIFTIMSLDSATDPKLRN